MNLIQFVKQVSENIGDEGSATPQAEMTASAILELATRADWAEWMRCDLMADDLLKALLQELKDAGYRAVISHSVLLIFRTGLMHTVIIQGEDILVSRVGTDYPMDSAIVWQKPLNMHIIGDPIPAIIDLINSPSD